MLGVGILTQNQSLQTEKNLCISKSSSSNVFSLKAETPEEERENRRRRSPLRNRSDFNESRYGCGFINMFQLGLMTKHKVCAD